ncbi:cobyrinic Acid a,c-diamide synthase [gamma proteobacterium HTCC5015]|nr:cobyrinic Acid a,c-diamide synthase [gamma proteobacterium HTCC5015]
MTLQRYQVQTGQTGHAQIKNIIAVASGKGGVGKSTVTSNLAVALAQQGLSVGVLDADIYGPSQSMMLGNTGRPESPDGERMTPLEAHGVVFNSMAALVDQDQPMVWRGPMVSRALMQLLDETHWPELDILFVDMPPGTGDIQLTMAQKMPIAGAVVVTTPQDIALLDARRAVGMFEKVGIRTLGIVENMSTHVCSQCGHEEPLFGHGGGQSMAETLSVPLLGEWPLTIEIRAAGDEGSPMAARSGALGNVFEATAKATLKALQAGGRDYSAAFGAIKIESE